MAGDCIPVYEASYTQKLTANFTAAVFGRRFVAPLAAFQGTPANPLGGLDAGATGGNLVSAGLPAAGGATGGVAMYDVAAGGKGGVIRGAGTMLPVLSGAAVAVGDEVKVDAAGKVIPQGGTGIKVGKAHTVAAGADVEVVVELYSLEGA